MNTSEAGFVGDRRRRRRHSAEFKAQAVAACRKPGVSIASVALSYRLNANLLRRWVVEAEQSSPRRATTPVISPVEPRAGAAPAFVPVAVDERRGSRQEIRIEFRRGTTVVTVAWPVSAAEDCTAWLRELLR